MPLSPDSKMLAENCGKVCIYRHLWHIGGIKDMPQISIGKVSMTRLFVIPALGLIVLIGSVGCTKANRQPTLHVVSYDSCDRPQLVGVVGNKEFALNLDVDKNTGMTVACPNPGMSLKDIGKDYPVTVDLDHQTVALEIPNYEVPTLEELRKGNTQGRQNGTKKAVFLIDRMREVQTK